MLYPWGWRWRERSVKSSTHGVAGWEYWWSKPFRKGENLKESYSRVGSKGPLIIAAERCYVNKSVVIKTARDLALTNPPYEFMSRSPAKSLK